MDFGKKLEMNLEKQSNWCKTDEGKAYLETLEPYENLMEFFRDLSKIEKFDYTSANSNMEDAIEHSRKVLTVLAKSGKLDLAKNAKDVSDALKIIGCVPYKNADEKFGSTSHGIGNFCFEENVAFPLFAYTQLIDKNEVDFLVGMEVACDGIGKWLTTQKMAELANAKEK